MAGKPYATHPTEAVYGSRAEDILELSQLLSTGICWDFGHANMTGLCQSAELDKLRGRVRVVHIHDNDGCTDSHSIPTVSSPSPDRVDWADAAEGLRLCGFLEIPHRCLDLELKSSHLPADRQSRLLHAAHALSAARHLAALM
jgi:sugar phosphate isomerase/epimerase